MVTLDLDLLPRQRDRDVAIVVDVLRMTTTAGVLFERGLAELIVVPELEEARQVAAQSGALLLGERGGRPPPGFDGGNSPVEYLERDLSGERAVLCTSNGSRAVAAASRSRHLLLGSIANAAAVARTALALARTGISVICAGTAGEVSMDDALAGAVIASEVRELGPVRVANDAARLAIAALRAFDDPGVGLETAAHGQHLCALGFGADLAFAASPNRLDAVPMRVGSSPARFRRASGGPEERRDFPQESAGSSTIR